MPSPIQPRDSQSEYSAKFFSRLTGWGASLRRRTTENVGPMAGHVLQNQLFHASGIAFREVLDHNFGPGPWNHPNGGEKQAVVDLYARNVGVENKVVGSPDQLADSESNTLIVENNLVVPDRVFKTAAAKSFVWHKSISELVNERISE